MPTMALDGGYHGPWGMRGTHRCPVGELREPTQDACPPLFPYDDRRGRDSTYLSILDKNSPAEKEEGATVHWHGSDSPNSRRAAGREPRLPPQRAGTDACRGRYLRKVGNPHSWPRNSRREPPRKPLSARRPRREEAKWQGPGCSRSLYGTFCK